MSYSSKNKHWIQEGLFGSQSRAFIKMMHEKDLIYILSTQPYVMYLRDCVEVSVFLGNSKRDITF